jgi:hypothetical protein
MRGHARHASQLTSSEKSWAVGTSFHWLFPSFPHRKMPSQGSRPKRPKATMFNPETRYREELRAPWRRNFRGFSFVVTGALGLWMVGVYASLSAFVRPSPQLPDVEFCGLCQRCLLRTLVSIRELRRIMFSAISGDGNKTLLWASAASD